ncbi:Geranylgeranyl pyrophosphate synthase [Tistlia consotensis]|uniref:Geranylgeranyl pyrophosphate synthase n=1 Tax=Tistlia consotensis USBA 355 TaxID=560819 RepID=A0A1Y6CNF2_9PROT|nr:polyprenyl synthetase family protein [Tistlia consotensis]SMF78899.1 Geranylgeranyl pyrophosphate synthase [Tistlia consotensis USBA 355]SNS15152.1 Geranylgeranyl pyrophosphate synthase [Tistlia consotensis]
MAWIDGLADELARSEGQRDLLRLASAELAAKDSQTRAVLGFSPFATLPVAVFEAVAPQRPVPIALPAASALCFLALDVLDDLADGDWPAHWGERQPAELELTGVLILSVRVPEALARTTGDPALLAALGAVHRRSLLRMADGQREDLAAPGPASWEMATARRVLSARGPDQASGYAEMAALLAGAGPETVRQLAAYAHHLGGALTLTSDLADLLSPEGRDLKQGKRTLPLAAHVNAMAASERPALLARLEAARTSEAEREALRQELNASPAVAAAMAYRDIDLAMARAALTRAELPDPGRLSDFVEAVAGLG